MILLEGGYEQVPDYHLGFQDHQRTLLLEHCLQLFHKKISPILNHLETGPLGETSAVR